MTTDQARRRTLRLAVLCLAGSAGCTTDSTGTDGPTARDGTDWNDPTDADASGTDAHPTTGGQEAAPSETSVTATDAGETETDRTADDLDLREANVTEVAVEETGSGCEFAVTLYHDDDGEDGYANWWQVETPDGDRLGRRDLLHPTRPNPSPGRKR